MIQRHSEQFHTPVIFTMMLLGNVWAYATPAVHIRTHAIAIVTLVRDIKNNAGDYAPILGLIYS